MPKLNWFVLLLLTVSVGAEFSCRKKNKNLEQVSSVSIPEDSITTSYTVAMPDKNGEGLRMTYTFYDMKRADTGAFKMTHVYMHYTGTDDTTVVNGTWRLFDTDTGKYIIAWSGRGVKRFDFSGNWNIVTMNTDSALADTGRVLLRQKSINNLHNSTVVLEGKVFFNSSKTAYFIDDNRDTLPILKISAFADLVALNDSVPLNSSEIKAVEFAGVIQIRMAMDGRSTSRSVIVEKIRKVKR